MERVRRRLQVKEGVRRQARSIAGLAPLLLISLLVAIFLWRAELDASGGLFQSSPASPTPPPTNTEPAQASPSPTETAGTVEPTGAVTSTAPALTETPTPLPTETPTATPAPTETPEPTLTPTAVVPTATDTVVPASPVPTEVAGDRYADEDSNLRFDWRLLFDSVALGLSYLWLGCGALLLLAVPLFFFVLWFLGKRREEEGEDGEQQLEHGEQQTE